MSALRVWVQFVKFGINSEFEHLPRVRVGSILNLVQISQRQVCPACVWVQFSNVRPAALLKNLPRVRVGSIT